MSRPPARSLTAANVSAPFTCRKQTPGDDRRVIDTGETAWLLVCTGLVMLMTPALALFYGGMVQGKNVLSTFMHSFFALGIVTVQFAVIGYSLCFGASWHGVIGGLDFFAMNNVGEQAYDASHGFP